MPDREPMREALMIAQLTHGGHGAPNNILQRAIADIEPMNVDVAALQRRRDRMVQALSSYGYELHSPEGTFYLLPTTRSPTTSRSWTVWRRTRCSCCPVRSSRCPGGSGSR
jgi:aspartate aminotransferase